MGFGCGKSEIRISKLETKSKFERGEKFETAEGRVLVFPGSSFGFVSDFGIRDSDLSTGAICDWGLGIVKGSGLLKRNWGRQD